MSSQDPLVVFTPSGKRGQFPVGTPVLTVTSAAWGRSRQRLWRAGHLFQVPDHAGLWRVLQTRVTARDGALSDWNAVEARYDEKRGLKQGRRLGCQARVQGDIVIDVPPESQVHRQVVRKAASARVIKMDPATRLYYIVVDEPDMHTPTGDLERVARALKDQWEIPEITCAFPALTKLQTTLRKGKWAITVALHKTSADATPQIIATWPGLHETGLYGLAIDLGSTTVAAHLTNLDTGEVVASSGIDEPADPLWRRPDEPRVLCHDEPRRRR